VLHSDRTPDEAETEIQADIEQLNSTPVQLQHCRSKRALRLRESIQKQLGDHESILSPFSRLPPEIISMIFLMCPQGGTLTAREAPLLLCRICSQWRNIALDTHQLWCNPRCVIRTGCFDRAIAGLATSLERSGHVRPLNLSLHLEDRSYHAHRYIELFEVAKSVSLRWKSLAINLSNSSSFFGVIKQLDSMNLAQLESLAIVNLGDCQSHYHPAQPAGPLLSAAPGLQTLTIEGFSPELVLQHVFVKNLTKLRMMNISYLEVFDHHYTPDDYLQLLEQCSNLTHCAIHCILERGSSQPRPRTLPKMIHLKIRGYCLHFDAVKVLLDALTLPQLESVSIDFEFDELLFHVTNYVPTLADHPRDAFQAFIERSSQRLSLVSRAAHPSFFEMVAYYPGRTILTWDGE